MEPLTPVPSVPVDPRLSHLDAPVRRLFERVADAVSDGTPDLSAIGDAMIELAADHDYIVTRVSMLGSRTGSVGIHLPERGPRLMLVHRGEGQMGAIHDHGCWVGLAPIVGIETHRRFRVMASPEQVARLELLEERMVGPAEAITMLAPDDVHAHGHRSGTGETAYVLILTGDDQRLYQRTEWDTVTGRARILRPGDGGRWLDSEPFPG